jgi:hypothetical protein
MEIIASKVLYEEDQTSLYNQLLAVKTGRPLCSRDLSEGISGMHRFLKYTNISELTCNGVLDSQAGHSQQTASRIYGWSNFDHPSIGRDEFQLYQLVSIEWHRLLHLTSDTLLPYQALANQNYPSAVPASAMGNVYHHHHHQIKVVHSVGDIGIDFPSLTCSATVLSSLFAWDTTSSGAHIRPRQYIGF